MQIEHCDYLSWFSRRGESHEQDGKRLSGAAIVRELQRLAILPWLSGLLGADGRTISRRRGIGSVHAAG
jgi:hypothetical protein